MTDERLPLSGERRLLNPWLTMWFKPRETIQQIIDINPGKHLYVLGIVVCQLVCWSFI
ncbi:MAG: hypothetical protein GY718_02150 [Lentisphaerae bacterium]|nr:hypothetical protein [Lentisphaerota bacterium]